MTDESDREPGESPTASVARRRLSTWLTGLTTVVIVVSIFSTWVQVQALDTATWVTLIVVVALYASALDLAVGNRWRAVRNVGFSLLA